MKKVAKIYYMKRFLKVFSLIVIFIGAFFLLSPEARANFTESFSEVVDSLRGVEEEAVKIFMPQPQSVEDIVLGNRESEALTAEGVLFESGLSPISYLGNCDDNSIGMENRDHAIKFLSEYEKLMNGEEDSAGETDNSFISRMNSDRNKINNFISNPGFRVEEQCDFYDVRWDSTSLRDLDHTFKIFINDKDVTINKFTNASQIILKTGMNYRLYLKVYDMYGNEYTTSNFSFGNNTPATPEGPGDITLVSTGISPEFTTECSTPAIFEKEAVENNLIIEGSSGIYSFSSGNASTKYYKFEYKGQVIYSISPSFSFSISGSEINMAGVGIELLNDCGDTGSTFVAYINHGTSGGECNSNWSWVSKEGIELFYFDENDWSSPSWNTAPKEIVVESNRLYITIDPPSQQSSILVRSNGKVFYQTGWNEDIDPGNDGNNHNIYIGIPESVKGEIELIASKGAGRISQAIKINLNDYPYVPLSYDIDDPSFVPKFDEQYPFGYDMLGATQIESGFPGLPTVDEIARVRAFKFYIDGKCIGQQKAWNIIEDTGILNSIYLLTYSVISNLPPDSNLTYEIIAVGFNGNESQPLTTTLVTYLEPTVELLDIGVVDTNWIVYDEFVYIYYYLSMNRQEYQQYILDGNFIWMTVEMCCDENQRLYYPTIQFKPIPDYATCSDLTIVNRSYTNNPAFLGVRTNPDLEVTEFIKNDDESSLSFQNSGGLIGDVIYSVNGQDVFSEVQLADIFNNLSAGEIIEMVVGRNGRAVELNIELSTYPNRFNIEEINNATGCFDSSGRAVGVFKIKMNQGYQKDQYINRFQFYQIDSDAESRWPDENTMFYASYKEFYKNGNIYHGIGPGDQLASYGTHNVDFSKTSFTIASNLRRASSKPVLITSSENIESDEGLAIENDNFQPSESFGEPLSVYYFDLADAKYLEDNNLIPSFNKATFGDCCFRDESTTERRDRVFPAGSKIMYFTPEAPVLKGWNLHSLTCNFVVLNKEYDSNNPLYQPPNPYIPEDGIIPFVTILEKNVQPGEECQFDFSEFQQFPFYGIGVTACYINEEGAYYCIKSDFTTFPFASWG
jgi:hypothetical protein